MLKKEQSYISTLPLDLHILFYDELYLCIYLDHTVLVSREVNSKCG